MGRPARAQFYLTNHYSGTYYDGLTEFEVPTHSCFDYFLVNHAK